VNRPLAVTSNLRLSGSIGASESRDRKCLALAFFIGFISFRWTLYWSISVPINVPEYRFFKQILSFFIIAAFHALFSLPLVAAENPAVAIRTVSGEIQIDGLLTEPEWTQNPHLIDLTQVEPNPGEPPTEATRVWLAYDKDALYIAVRCEDQYPEQIVATEMGRDAKLVDFQTGVNDILEIILDTYHDHRNAYYFSTNPVGALVDGRVTENQSPAMEWDGIWIVRTNIDEKGWTAEFKIPFKTVGFNPRLSTWGFNISRFLVRGRETSRWSSPSLDTQISQVSNAGSITGLEDLSQGVGLDIKPYGIAGVSRDITRQDVVQPDFDAGTDIFYRVTSNLVSSTTINTDFAETEADTRQVNLTRFKLFYPEKRSFFLEDAGIFEFAKVESHGPPGKNLGGDFIPFFSRRIGLVNNEMGYSFEVPLIVGQKVTGKIGKFDVGLLDVQTARFSEPDTDYRPGIQVASKNLFVGRVKANFLSQSYIGAIFTNGDPTGQTSNQTGGVDIKLATSNFLNRRKNLSLMLFGSKTKTTNLNNRDATYGGVISYPNDFLEFEYKWMKIEENYNPALGFVPREGVRISAFSTDLKPRPNFWNIRQLMFEFEYEDYYRLDQGAWETKEMRLTPFGLISEGGDFFRYELHWNREQLFEPWMINRREEIVLPVGQYEFTTHNFMFKTSDARSISMNHDFSTGSFYSGTRHTYFGGFTWRKDRHLNTSIQFIQNWIKLKEGDFNTSLFIYRLNYSFTPFITLANLVQYDTDSENIGLQSRLRWIMKPGNEFYVVFNHSWQENALDRFESDQTRFRVKLNYVFRF